MRLFFVAIATAELTSSASRYGNEAKASLCAYAVYARARMDDATLKNEPADFYKKYEKDFTLEGTGFFRCLDASAGHAASSPRFAPSR